MKTRFLLGMALVTMLTITGCSLSPSNIPAESQSTKPSEAVTLSEEINETEESNMNETTETQTDTTLTYIGHASVKIKTSDGKVIYIDPNYIDGDYSDKADYIFITHGHSDHQPCYKVEENEGCQTITYKEALIDGTYETFDFGSFQVQAVAASNSNHDINTCVGYIFTVDGIKIYHAGDTSKLDQMADLTALQIDYAMYPIDGTYNMDAVEATEVATLVGAKVNIPIHELDKDGIAKSDNFTPEGRLILSYGETITLSNNQ